MSMTNSGVPRISFRGGGGGGVQNIFGKVGLFALRFVTRLLGGFGGMLPQEFFI